MYGAIAKNKNKWKKILFYTCLIVLPLLQFLVFYVYVNINSFILAFHSYNVFTDESTFVGFENFKYVINEFFINGAFNIMFKNSLILWVGLMFVGLPCAVIFSYYIYKKGQFSNFFKTILYMPSVISPVIFVIIFKYFSELGVPSIWNTITHKEIEGLYTNLDTAYPTVVFYNIYIGFGTQVLMYLSAMSGIDVSVQEAAKLDGAKYLAEFWYITVPLIFSTITTFILTGLAGIFNNQANLFSFDGILVPVQIQTPGYYLYKELQINSTSMSAWPPLSAISLIFTFTVAPITFLVRFLLNKFGPKEV